MELDHVDGVEGKLKVWIRRVWTLEMVRIFLAIHFEQKLLTFGVRRASSGFDDDSWLAHT